MQGGPAFPPKSDGRTRAGVAALAVGLGAVWVTGDASVFGVVGIIAAMIGTGLVGYFNWRAKFRRRIPSATDDERRAA